MGDKSKIEWTATRDADGNVVNEGATWNVVTGCSRVSEGCRNCYAERLAATRLAHLPAYEGTARMTPDGPRWTGAVRFNAERLDLPLRWRRPRLVFVNSQSDLFHEGLADHLISVVFGIMALAPQHTFQILTKRPERARQWFQRVQAPDQFGTSDPLSRIVSAAVIAGGVKPEATVGARLRWPLPNVWLGVSVEDQATADQRIPLLLECPAAVRWISAEPLLGPIDLTNITEVRSGVTVMFSTVPQVRVGDSMQVRTKVDALAGYNDNGQHTRLDWVVVGGESGPGARPMHPCWARQLRDQCVAAGVPFFFKQHGAWESVGGHWRRGDSIVWPDGAAHVIAGGEFAVDPSAATMRHVGKRAAGRLLDGRTWDEMPVAKASAA